ncbi:hypothetical protein ACGFYM_32270 [Streptomyces sp. NPDC048231]|uniref:hypothetical protein n=1 Tax=Streptomyces sp. NPDC048231 TaxID=3365519 RepID=UPI00372053B3
MWPGQQPPGGEQNPQNQNPYQQPGYQQQNPYQQPGYQQPNPYQQPGGPQWGPPTPMGAPQPPGGGGNRTKVVAIVSAAAVVVTAGVTAFLVLGGDKDDKAGGDDKPSASTSQSATPSTSASANPRGGESEKPTVPGWKVVVNPKWGTAFDVPPEWDVKSPGLLIGFEDDNPKAEGKPLITMSAPAFLKEKWCTSDDNEDGQTDDKALAGTGTKGASGAKSTDEVAVNQVAWWVYGGYTQPDKKSITFDKKAKPYTTAAGIQGSIAWARSKNTPQKGKCASDGKAVTFGFKNSAGDFVAWSLYGATGVKDEVPDATILKILSTVRLHGDPTAS